MATGVSTTVLLRSKLFFHISGMAAWVFHIPWRLLVPPSIFMAALRCNGQHYAVTFVCTLGGQWLIGGRVWYFGLWYFGVSYSVALWWDYSVAWWHTAICFVLGISLALCGMQHL